MSAIQTVTRCVIDDVVNNLKESFKREGIDESVLSDLQKLWEQKMAQTMAASGAVSEASSSDLYAEEKTNKKKRPRKPATSATEYIQASEFALPPFNQMSALLPESGDDVVEGGVPAQHDYADIGKPSPYLDPVYSQQLAYQQQVYYPPHQLHYAQQIPSALHLQQQHLQYPHHQYAMPPQQAPPQTYNYLRQYQQQQQLQQQPQQQGEPSSKRQRVNPNEVYQVDGTDDDDLDALGEELNSEDDDDEDDFINTDDLLFALADKVSRTKNKWKCNLKYGIMTLKGRDYAFNKASGDFEW